ncbi:MAG: hypothetical protein ABW277_04930 [Longimicrobiaceae bacterium]
MVGPGAVPRGLAPEQGALLGVALAFHRAPLIARGGEFVSRFVRWRAQAASPASTRTEEEPPVRAAPPSSSSRPDPDAGPGPPVPVEAAPPPPAPPQAVRAAAGDGGRGDGASATWEAAAGASPPAAAGELPESGPLAAGPPPGERPAGAPRGPGDGSPGVDRPSPAEVERREPPPRLVPPPVEAVETMSGACGVFYLVNAVRALGFFPALDEHFRLPPVVGGWGWIELLARALLTPRAAGLAHDPVWRVLAGLDGRGPDEPAGHGFIAPGAETLPGAWAALLPDTGAARPAPPPPLGLDPPPPLRRFLGLVVPFVRLRLEAALRAAGAEDGLETALFRRVGLIQATRAHVEVRMELDQASLPVRLAGLDANPGWVPELARVVTFHYA